MSNTVAEGSEKKLRLMTILLVIVGVAALALLGALVTQVGNGGANTTAYNFSTSVSAANQGRIQIWEPGKSEFTACFNKKGEAPMNWLITADGSLGTPPAGSDIPYQLKLIDGTDANHVWADWGYAPGVWSHLGKGTTLYNVISKAITYKNTHPFMKNGELNWDIRFRALLKDGKTFGKEKQFKLVIKPYGSKICDSLSTEQNAAPKVTMIAPAQDNLQIVNQPQNTPLMFWAGVSDEDVNDTIGSVIFYVMRDDRGYEKKITGVFDNGNWTGLWSDFAVGTYTLSTTATDSRGLQSNPVLRKFEIKNTTPTPIEYPVSFTKPGDGDRFVPQSAIAMTVAITNEKITKVQFNASHIDPSQGTNIWSEEGKITGTGKNRVAQATWQATPAGVYQITAQGFDATNKEIGRSSTVVVISTEVPQNSGSATIKLTQPTATKFDAGKTVTVLADTQATGGATIAEVWFVIENKTGKTKTTTGRMTKAPFKYDIKGDGSYEIRAYAKTSQGVVIGSDTMNFVIGPVSSTPGGGAGGGDTPIHDDEQAN